MNEDVPWLIYHKKKKKRGLSPWPNIQKHQLPVNKFASEKKAQVQHHQNEPQILQIKWSTSFFDK